MLEKLALRKELAQTQIALSTLRQAYDALLIRNGHVALTEVEREIREQGEQKKEDSGIDQQG
ncbi:MAG: hypothetical protein WA003_15830 [Desulfuromonadaceae bacterium]